MIGRWRTAAVVVAVVAAMAVLIGLALSGGTSAPAAAADRLVPADALLYLHASTDTGREQDGRMMRLLERFPAFRRLRAGAERSLAPRPGAVTLRRDVRPWLGDEAAAAVTPRGTLVLLAVEDRDRAQGVLGRVAGGGTASRHRRTLIQRFSGGAAAFVEGFLAVGPPAEVVRVIDLAAGRGENLAERADFSRAAASRPDDRVLDLWIGPGARRLAGAAADRLPDAAALLSAAPRQDGLRIDGRLLGSLGEDFSPELVDAAPGGAVAYAGLRSLRPLADLLPRRGAAARRFAAALRPLVAALDQEVAITVSPAQPDPIVTLVGRAGDPSSARVALGSLQAVVTELLTGSEADTGLVPRFEERDLGDGHSAFTLRLAGGGALVTAVRGERVAISNAEDGARRALTNEGDSIEDAAGFRATVGDPPRPAQALGFLDLSQLLALGKRAGLAGFPAFEAVSDDLRRVRAVGAVMQRQGDDTTLELNLQIP